MSQPEKFIKRIMDGASDANISFSELCAFLKRLGFEERIRGDQHIFTKEDVEEILNLQPKCAWAKCRGAWHAPPGPYPQIPVGTYSQVG